jgi:hypothetical protein
MLIPYVGQKELNLLFYWVNWRHHLQVIINVNEFAPVAAEAFAKLMIFEMKQAMLIHRVSSK